MEQRKVDIIKETIGTYYQGDEFQIKEFIDFLLKQDLEAQKQYISELKIGMFLAYNNEYENIKQIFEELRKNFPHKEIQELITRFELQGIFDYSSHSLREELFKNVDSLINSLSGKYWVYYKAIKADFEGNKDLYIDTIEALAYSGFEPAYQMYMDILFSDTEEYKNDEQTLQEIEKEVIELAGIYDDYDSLGGFYYTIGDKQKAIKNYTIGIGKGNKESIYLALNAYYDLYEETQGEKYKENIERYTHVLKKMDHKTEQDVYSIYTLEGDYYLKIIGDKQKALKFYLKAYKHAGQISYTGGREAMGKRIYQNFHKQLSQKFLYSIVADLFGINPRNIDILLDFHYITKDKIGFLLVSLFMFDMFGKMDGIEKFIDTNKNDIVELLVSRGTISYNIFEPLDKKEKEKLHNILQKEVGKRAGMFIENGALKPEDLPYFMEANLKASMEYNIGLRENKKIKDILEPILAKLDQKLLALDDSIIQIAKEGKISEDNMGLLEELGLTKEIISTDVMGDFIDQALKNTDEELLNKGKQDFDLKALESVGQKLNDEADLIRKFIFLLDLEDSIKGNVSAGEGLYLSHILAMIDIASPELDDVVNISKYIEKIEGLYISDIKYANLVLYLFLKERILKELSEDIYGNLEYTFVQLEKNMFNFNKIENIHFNQKYVTDNVEALFKKVLKYEKIDEVDLDTIRFILTFELSHEGEGYVRSKNEFVNGNTVFLDGYMPVNTLPKMGFETKYVILSNKKGKKGGGGGGDSSIQ